jgi:CHAT domain
MPEESARVEYEECRVSVENSTQRWVLPVKSPPEKDEVPQDPLRRKVVRILSRWLAEDRIKTREEIVLLGSCLYELLFSDKLSGVFLKALKNAQKRSATLRVILEFKPDARDLAEMPWEYIYCPDQTEKGKGFFLAARNSLILTRHVPLNLEEDDLKPGPRPLRILIVVSQPSGEYTTVKADDVLSQIEKLKDKSPGTIETTQLRQPTKKSLGEHLKKRPHVVHFIGHGRYGKTGEDEDEQDGEERQEKVGQLILVSEEDLKSPVPIIDEDFADCFSDYQPRVIFLHACEGAHTESYETFRGVALQLVYSRVPAVVAMQYQITNRVATSFANEFYQSLSEGKPIDVAVQNGRMRIGMRLDERKRNFTSRDFGSPVVYLQSTEGIVIAEKGETADRREPAQEKVLCPCGNCMEYVTADDKYCGAGHELAKCPNCGAVMEPNKNCRKCPYRAASVARPELSPAERVPLAATIAETATVVSAAVSGVVGPGQESAPPTPSGLGKIDLQAPQRNTPGVPGGT